MKAVLVITGLALLLAAAPAQAATRYASPSGTGAYPCTDNSSQAAMCPVDIAVNGASGSDDVVLANGTYATNFQMLIQPDVTVHGTPGSPPTIIGNATNAGLGEIRLSSGSTLRDVRVEVGDGPTFSTAVVNWSGHMERVYAYTPGLFNNEGCTVAQLGGVVPTVTDSVCVTDSIGHYGLRAGTLGQSGTVALRNVTAVGRGGAAAGIQALSNGDTLTVNASNVIADGPTNDVEARNDASGDKTLHPVTVNLDHSNYATVSFPGGTAGVSATTAGSGTNVTQAPVFRDAANGDFRQTATSAGTIDRGTATALSGGELDIEGGARNQGAAPDIGADEIAVTSAPTVTAPVVAGSTSVSGTTSEADGTTILIRVNNVEQASSGISSGGAWTVNSLPAIQAGDSVKASATAPDKTTSAFSTPVVAVLRTTTPAISAPVIVGATAVSGTSAEDGSSIQLFVDGLAAGTNPVVAGGTWSVTGLAPLTAGQLLKANATKSGEATSFDSTTTTVIARTATPVINAPVIAGATSSTGTSSEDGSTIHLIVGATEVGTALVSGGTWTVGGLTPLTMGAVLTANATKSGEATSFDSATTTVIARTSTPVINAPVIAGATSAAGTSAENGSTIHLFVGATEVGSALVSGGTWTVGGLTPLTVGAVLTANATKSGEATSFDSDAVTVQAAPQPPTGTTPAPPAGTQKKCKKGSKLKHGKCVKKKKKKK